MRNRGNAIDDVPEIELNQAHTHTLSLTFKLFRRALEIGLNFMCHMHENRNSESNRTMSKVTFKQQ